MRKTILLAVVFSLVALSSAVAAAAQETVLASAKLEGSGDVPTVVSLEVPKSTELPLPAEVVYRDECPAIQEVPESADRYSEFARKHRLIGTASYYSAFFEGRRTASGEIYHNRGLTAAHRTLPLGTLVEVTSRATGKTVRVRVNDRGPFSGGFILDLTPAAARRIGVDRTEDRTVDIRILALPGEDVPSEDDSTTVASRQ